MWLCSLAPAGRQAAILQLWHSSERFPCDEEPGNLCQCRFEGDEEDWEAEDEEAISRASIAMSADALAREQVSMPPNLWQSLLVRTLLLQNAVSQLWEVDST